jgi:AcrR family transcriptional regulator
MRQMGTQRHPTVQDFPAHRYRPRVAKRESAGQSSGSGLPRLPPGRHGLSREFVAQNQRDRLTAGTIATVAERGYHETTISQITAAAGVSRRTFYAYFASKQDCFFATFDQILAHLSVAAADAAAAFSRWPDRVSARFVAVLDAFTANPDLARFVLLAPPRAGGEIAAHYRDAVDRGLAEMTEGIPTDVALPSQAAQDAMVGGVAALIARTVEAGEGERLPELLPDLVELSLTPYLGREQAQRAARRSSQRPS